MREFNTRIVESLSNGLRPEERVSRDRPFLQEALNTRVENYGLDRPTNILDPFEGTFTSSYPFPQLFVGKKVTLVADNRQIYEVDTNVSPWEYSLLDIYDKDGVEISQLPMGSRWHFIDLYDSWYLFNEECIVFLTYEEEFKIGGETVPRIVKDVTIKTGTEFRGRVITGGFDSNNIWSQWESYFNDISGSIDLPIWDSFGDIDSSYVMWSSIGGGDFPLYLFYFSFVNSPLVEGSETWNNVLRDSSFTSLLKRNEWGFMPMDWQGEVKRILPLGDQVVVYGDNGITALVPTTSSEPAVANTFGRTELSSVGIASRDAVGGDESNHLFISKRGDLWSVTSEGVNKLGYSEYIEPMLSEDPIIEYNPDEEEFYIVSNNKCYIFNNGLSEISDRPTTLEFHGGYLQGLYEEGDTTFRVVSNPITMNTSSLKTVTVVSLNTRGLDNVRVALDYKIKKSNEWKRTRFYPTNDEGNCELRLQALGFRVVIEADNYNDFELDYIEVRYQAGDRRFIRGTRADTSNT